jgi:hypothetical protein
MGGNLNLEESLNQFIIKVDNLTTQQHNYDSMRERKNTYSCNGNLIKHHYVGLNGSTGTIINSVFDENNNVVTKTMSSSPYRWYFNYDQYRNKISQTTLFSNTGKLFSHITYQYEYDAKGNWIKKIEIKDDKIVTCSTRKIEYH